MRIDVDFTRCASHGECAAAAGDVFELDAADELHFVAEPDPDARSRVERAVRACPTQAIRIVA